MMFRFSTKLMFSNFTTMWKILLYYIIVSAILIALGVGLLLPTISFFLGEIHEIALVDNIHGLFKSFLSPEDMGMYLDNLTNGISNISTAFIKDGGSLVFSTIVVFVLILLGYFLYGLVQLPASTVMNAKMNSQLKLSFTATFLSKLGKSIKYTLSKMIFTIPFDLFIAVTCFFMLYSIRVFGIFGLTLTSLYFVFIVAIRISLFTGWLPAIVVDGLSVFKAFKYGTKKAFSRFWRIVSSIIIFMYLYLIISLALNFITFGSAIVLLVPIWRLYMLLFELCMYYGATARRYFVDYDTIITPKTLRDKNEELINGINDTSISEEQMFNDINDDLKNAVKTLTIEVDDEIKTIDSNVNYK